MICCSCPKWIKPWYMSFVVARHRNPRTKDAWHIHIPYFSLRLSWYTHIHLLYLCPNGCPCARWHVLASSLSKLSLQNKGKPRCMLGCGIAHSLHLSTIYPKEWSMSVLSKINKIILLRLICVGGLATKLISRGHWMERAMAYGYPAALTQLLSSYTHPFFFTNQLRTKLWFLRVFFVLK
jgi:hypothetical protein